MRAGLQWTLAMTGCTIAGVAVAAVSLQPTERLSAASFNQALEHVQDLLMRLFAFGGVPFIAFCTGVLLGGAMVGWWHQAHPRSALLMADVRSPDATFVASVGYLASHPRSKEQSTSLAAARILQAAARGTLFIWGQTASNRARRLSVREIRQITPILLAPSSDSPWNPGAALKLLVLRTQVERLVAPPTIIHVNASTP
jgi:hypothetical protein